MGSFLGKLVYSILERLFTKLIALGISLLEKAKLKKARDKAQEQAKEDFTEVRLKETSTEQERADAYEKYINSGN